MSWVQKETGVSKQERRAGVTEGAGAWTRGRRMRHPQRRHEMRCSERPWDRGPQGVDPERTEGTLPTPRAALTTKPHRHCALTGRGGKGRSGQDGPLARPCWWLRRLSCPASSVRAAASFPPGPTGPYGLGASPAAWSNPRPARPCLQDTHTARPGVRGQPGIPMRTKSRS